MPCRSPLAAYRNTDGTISFSRDNTKCLGTVGHITFRCGVCRDCRLHKAREWSIRCTHEAQMHINNCWLTLTYKTDPCSIAKRDLQIFFKRLRNTGAKFSYFACGEYGDKLSRPHYHICLFGHDFTDKYPWKKSHGGLLYRSPTLEKCWKWGHALISELTPANAGYTARYSMKKITGDNAAEHYTREFNGLTVNVTPEFIVMSTRPPIGLSWLEKYYTDVFPHDHVIYNGKQCPVPVYYAKWLKIHHAKMFETVQANRKIHYQELEYETGKRIYQAAVARDLRTKNLIRGYENDPLPIRNTRQQSRRISPPLHPSTD